MTIEDKVNALLPTLRGQLEDLVRIPSISSSAFDQKFVRESAEKVAEYARERGFDARVIEHETADGKHGRPAVLAHREGAEGFPTVLLYAHHDVQPDGSREGWLSEPFEPSERDGRLYGRGTADDKAGVMLHMGAIEVCDPRVGITLFIEGEEEVGSPTFVDFLHAHRDELKADVMIVADSNNWKVGTPSLTTSLRGVVSARVHLKVLDHALHSGAYGGPVLDAVTLMARLIATLHDEEGNVAVEGLLSYDDAQVEYSPEDLRADAGVLEGVELAGSGSIASRLWTKPTITVIGMDVTSVAHSSNTLIPECSAAISMRIAPGQDPLLAAHALEKHLCSHAPFGAHVSVEIEEIGPSYRADTEHESTRISRAALEKAWGKPSVDIGVGGSIPFIASLAEVFPEANVLVTGVEDPDTRAHSQNESLHLDDWRRGIIAEAIFLSDLAAHHEQSVQGN